MLFTILLSYTAGLLTALAPCVLPLLPIILGGSFVADGKQNKKRPFIIVGSLVASLILFTLLLKASTVLIGIDPRVWSIASGLLVITLGLFMLFPDTWAKVIAKSGVEHRSQGLLAKAFANKNGTVSAILIGAALGPVFSSCSPTYAWVIATALPTSFGLGMIYLTAYVLGVATSLLAIALLGRKLLEKIKWASDPKGWFQRSIAVLFILVGIFIATGYDKKVQTYLVDKDFLNIKSLETKIVPGDDENSQNSDSDSDKEKFNVSPYNAPELAGLNDWINSNPLTIDNLKGKVVLIDFWTYSCINCIRTQPYLNAWHDKYSSDGLVILGIHAPEFAFEKVAENVIRAVEDAEIKYPVALDNEFDTWRAYENRFWPAKYLIDKDGQVRYTHFGEGEYEETEKIIQKLLRETGKSVKYNLEEGKNPSSIRGQTPETYLGYERGERFANSNQFVAEKPIDYSLVDNLGTNEWSLGGLWQVNDESSQSLSDSSKLKINYSAKELYLVMSGPPGSIIAPSVDGLEQLGGEDLDNNGRITIDEPRLYKVIKTDEYMINKQLTLTFPIGVTINAFTFGS